MSTGVHINDESIDESHQLKTYQLTSPEKEQFYRYFRIVQVGPTKYRAPEVI